jgi:hypothetical protein
MFRQKHLTNLQVFNGIHDLSIYVCPGPRIRRLRVHNIYQTGTIVAENRAIENSSISRPFNYTTTGSEQEKMTRTLLRSLLLRSISCRSW